MSKIGVKWTGICGNHAFTGATCKEAKGQVAKAMLDERWGFGFVVRPIVGTTYQASLWSRAKRPGRDRRGDFVRWSRK